MDVYSNYQITSIYERYMNMCIQMLEEKGFPPAQAHTFCRSTILAQFAQQSPPVVFQENYFAWSNPGIGRYIVFLSCQGVIFFTLVMLFEHWQQVTNCCCCVCRALNTIMCCLCRRREATVRYRSSSVALDSDVQEEQRRIANEYRENDVLTMQSLKKVFKVGREYTELRYLV